MYDSYGDLAGFNTFAGANDASEVPVVRYQDLHRKHAPASAGAVAVYGNTAPPPEFGADPMADEENLDGYGDVAYGDVAYGDVAYGGATRGNGAVAPLPVPTNVPVYAPQGGYGAYDPPERNPDVFALEGYPELSYLGQGMRHPDDLVPYVAVAQRLLVQQGAMSPTKTDGRASADGIFGDDTRLAVEAFQRTANLPVTGTIDWDTWTALYNLRGRKVRRRTGAQYGATPTAEESLYLRNLPALSEGIHLKNPDYETYIKQAQRLLIAQGALAATTDSGDSNADGKFGPTTESAVNRFKTAKRIVPVNGVIDYPTWLALYNLTEEAAPAKKADEKKKSGKGKGKEEERGSFWESFQATTGLSQFVDGDKQMVSGNGSTPPPPPPGVDWGKVALWGGVAVGGIALTYIIVRAVQNKKE